MASGRLLRDLHASNDSLNFSALDLNDTNSIGTSSSVCYVPGRPPWYDEQGSKKHAAYVIGIGGGSASGKTSVSQMLIKSLDVPWVVLLSQDSFYKNVTGDNLQKVKDGQYDFDHPDAFDWDILIETLAKLKEGKNVQVPIYDFKTHSRLPKTRTVYGANVIVFEGIFALYNRAVMDLMDIKLFIDTDADLRLARRLKRDIAERGRDLHGVLKQYSKFVKPSYDDYVHPTVRKADVIIPRGADNTVAVNLIAKHIARQVNDRGFSFRSKLADAPREAKFPDNVIVLKPSNHLKALHTIIRDSTTPRDEFIFYAERLASIIVERGLNELPFSPQNIMTPHGYPYKGLAMQRKICGVSIVRAGATMEVGLRKVAEHIKIGKILIQTNAISREPQLHYCKLPPDISERYCLLLDAQIATGACMMMAVRILLDHEIPEDHIIILTFIGTPQGLHSVISAFPKVKIITSEVDLKLNEKFWIVPGMGNFGDRYFGTS